MSRHLFAFPLVTLATACTHPGTGSWVSVCGVLMGPGFVRDEKMSMYTWGGREEVPEGVLDDINRVVERIGRDAGEIRDPIARIQDVYEEYGLENPAPEFTVRFPPGDVVRRWYLEDLTFDRFMATSTKDPGVEAVEPADISQMDMAVYNTLLPEEEPVFLSFTDGELNDESVYCDNPVCGTHGAMCFPAGDKTHDQVIFVIAGMQYMGYY